MAIAGKRAVIGVGGIPSIQAFSVSFASSKTQTATIASVDTTRSIIVLAGMSVSGADASMPMYVELTNATTVTITRTLSTTSTTVVRGFVLTYPIGIIKSIQRGLIAMTNAETSKNTTVTAVSTSKSFLTYLGSITDLTNTGSGTVNPYVASTTQLQLTTSTNIAATRGSVTISGGTPSNVTNTTSYELIEFF